MWIIPDIIISIRLNYKTNVFYYYLQFIFPALTHFQLRTPHHSPIEIKRFQVWLLHSDFMNVLLKKKKKIICCSNTYKVPNSKSLLMNSSSILVSTMGFSKALWTSCPIIKEVKKTNSEWNLYSHQYFRLNNVAQCHAQGKPNQSCPSRGANLMCDIWVTLLFRNIVTLGRKDDRKRRAKESIQGRMQIMEQHQENTSSYFSVRPHWIIRARGWGAPT